PKLSDFCEDMCRGLDAERFAQTAGIPVDMSRIFAKPLCARNRCRSSKKSLNLGYRYDWIRTQHA
ncbi:MAG: hypothetical protein WAL93_03095, partial [Desulfobacterales bacterium]